MARNAKERQRGIVAVLVALVLVVIAGFLALSLDGGHLVAVRGELQNASDAGALAGAADLDGTAAGVATAETSAVDYVKLHASDAKAIDPGDARVVPGYWDRTTQRFDPGVTDPASINAVWVRTAQQKPLFVAPVVTSTSTAGVAAEAVAASGAPCGPNCADFPFVLQAGCIDSKCTPGGGESGGFYSLGLSSNIGDTAGLTNLMPDTVVQSPDLCDILLDPQYCLDRNVSPSQGQVVQTSNGAQFGKTCLNGETICEIIRDRLGTQGRVPVVQYTPGACNANYVAGATIVGWATLRVAAVQCKKNNDTLKFAPQLTDADKASLSSWCASTMSGGSNASPQVCIFVELLCNQKSDDAGGSCNWYGTWGRPTLVPYTLVSQPP